MNYARAMHLTDRDAKVYEAEAYRCYNDGLIAESNGNATEAIRHYELAESYLEDAGIPFTGKGKEMSWSF